MKLGQSLANNPIKAQEVDINQVKAQGLGVISDGQALVEHGKVMTELSDLLKRRTDASGDQPLAQDVADAQAGALRISPSRKTSPMPKPVRCVWDRPASKSSRAVSNSSTSPTRLRGVLGADSACRSVAGCAQAACVPQTRVTAMPARLAAGLCARLWPDRTFTGKLIPAVPTHPPAPGVVHRRRLAEAGPSRGSGASPTRQALVVGGSEAKHLRRGRPQRHDAEARAKH